MTGGRIPMVNPSHSTAKFISGISRFLRQIRPSDGNKILMFCKGKTWHSEQFTITQTTSSAQEGGPRGLRDPLLETKQHRRDGPGKAGQTGARRAGGGREVTAVASPAASSGLGTMSARRVPAPSSASAAGEEAGCAVPRASLRSADRTGGLCSAPGEGGGGAPFPVLQGLQVISTGPSPGPWSPATALGRHEGLGMCGPWMGAQGGRGEGLCETVPLLDERAACFTAEPQAQTPSIYSRLHVEKYQDQGSGL